MTGLKPCPFEHCQNRSVFVGTTIIKSQPAVLCDMCGAEGPTGKTISEAARLWNERAGEEG